MRIAIYDLDKTLTVRATFTPFLIFAASKLAPWRLVLLPLWVLAMLVYKAKVITRARLKETGLVLFLGGRVDDAILANLGVQFAERIILDGIGAGAARALAKDREDGWRLVMVTAAMEFYAVPIGRLLNFDKVIATRHDPLPEFGICRIYGDNCYGNEKPKRVEAMLASEGLQRSDCEIKFYTDSFSDAPLLDWSDKAVLVDPGRGAQECAHLRGWSTAIFRS